jgi:hypothetical protein
VCVSDVWENAPIEKAIGYGDAGEGSGGCLMGQATATTNHGRENRGRKCCTGRWKSWRRDWHSKS